MAQEPPRQVVKVVAALARAQQVVGDHRVPGDPADLDPVPAQGEHIELDILVDLGDGRVFQDGSERVQYGILRQQFRASRAPERSATAARP